MTLSVSDLSVAVGGRTLLTGFNLDLAPSERVALIGPSGSGKTSLLRTLAFLSDPAHGSVSLDGKSPTDLGVPAYRRRVAYLAQRPVLFAGSVKDNLRRPFAHAAVAETFDADAAATLLARLGLDEADLPAEARDLSEGQKQRVCLARGLLTHPEALLLDEPTSGLDAEARAAVETLLAERAEHDGCAVLWVTHDRQQAERACDRIVDLEAYLG